MNLQTARNVGIVALVALAVWLLPGGSEGADIIGKILSATFIVVTVLIVGTLYRQYRGEIFGLGDQWRFALYASVGIAVLTVSITGQMWDSPPAGPIVWFALVGGSSYMLYVIWQRYRSYS